MRSSSGTDLKNLLLSALGIGSKIAGNAGVFWLLAIRLSDAEFGSFNLFYSASVQAAMVVDFGMNSYLMVLAGRTTDRDALRGMMTQWAYLKLVLLAVVGGLSLLVARVFFDAVDPWPFLMVFVAVATVQSLPQFFVPRRDEGDYRSETLLGAFMHLAVFAALWIALSLDSEAGLRTGVFWFCCVRLAAIAVAVLLFGPRHFRLERPRASVMRDLLRSSLPFGLAMLLGGLLLNLDVLLLGLMRGATEVGTYSAGSRLFLAATMGVTVLHSVFVPSVARSDIEQAVKATRKNRFLLAAAVGGVIILAVMLVWPSSFVKLLYGSRYPDLASVLPYFAAVFLLRYANAGPSMILNVFGSWADRVVPVLAAVATLVAVALPLIPRLGLIGGGIALAAAHLVWWLVSLVRVSRLLAEARA